jgi:hypothetical protein
MQKSEIKPGTDYAVREKRTPGTPLQRVKILELARGKKWKVKWIDPNPGLVDYIESGKLIVPWSEHRAFLRDEAAMLRMREHNAHHGYMGNSPLDRALESIFDDVKDDVRFEEGWLGGTPEAIERVKTRARMDPLKQSPVSYVDRFGRVHLPFDEAVEVAKNFAGSEPQTVLVEVEATERKWAQEATRPGEEYMAGLLNEYRAAWALIRQWAGHDAAISEREARIKAMERLVWDAVYALQKAHLDDEASRIRRALERKR